MTTMESRVYRRVLRRETHAPRTAPAVVVAVVVLLASLALLVGGVWWWADAGFQGFVSARAADLGAAMAQPAVLIGIGAVALALALLLLILALSPGRRARRARTTERIALLVDDGILADAVADAVAAQENLGPRQVSVTLGRRAVTVRVTPTSGVPVDTGAVGCAAEAALAAVGFTAVPRVVVAAAGVVA